MEQFYVYAYLDSRKPGHYSFSGLSFLYEPIYIGLDSNKRYIDHLREAKRHEHIPKSSKTNILLFRKLRKCIVLGIECTPIILKKNLSLEVAKATEREFIKEIGRIDIETGTLCNFTDGGEGAFNLSEETRKKMSLSAKARGFNGGGCNSPEALENIRKAIYGYFRKYP